MVRNKVYFKLTKFVNGIEKGVYKKTESLMLKFFTQEEYAFIMNPYNYLDKHEADKVIQIGQMLYKYDKLLFNHCLRVAAFTAVCGKEMGIGDYHLLYLDGLLHDVGKMFIPPHILYKKGKLTDEEYAVMKDHTILGYQLLVREEITTPQISETAKSHHITYSGKGYPKLDKGTVLPLFTRIVTVGDSFDAMTSDRIYSKGKSLENTVAEIERCKGDMFDPNVADVFIRNAEIFYKTVKR